MVYLTGDTHRNFARIQYFCKGFQTSVDDVLVILGDAGINYHGAATDRYLKQQLAELPITLLCIHGNHEQRPETIGTYEEIEWRGGVVYQEPEFPNLLFAKDGDIYELDGKRCIAIGGAYSVDKHYRLQLGHKWWPDEQPSERTKCRVEVRLDMVDWRVDAVLAHTCPMKNVPIETFLPGIDQSTVDNSTEEWLDDVESRLNYDRWYCGHFHINKSDSKVRFLLDDIIALR